MLSYKVFQKDTPVSTIIYLLNHATNITVFEIEDHIMKQNWNEMAHTITHCASLVKTFCQIASTIEVQHIFQICLFLCSLFSNAFSITQTI
jgi:hypothetical protein